MATAASLARNLELDLAVSHLVTRLLPGAEAPPARYRFLAPILGKHPTLTTILAEGKSEALPPEWNALKSSQQSNVEFLHGMAALYRERVLAEIATGKVDPTHATLSSCLWATLLSADEFWLYFGCRFSQRNHTDRLTGVDVPSMLLEATAKAVLSVHAAEAARAAAAGHYSLAEPHFRCLDLCRQEPGDIAAHLAKVGLPCKIRVDPLRTQTVRSIAAGLLDDWCAALVREAEKILTDPDAIAKLPKGISKDYERALRSLEGFINLRIPAVRVLRTSLEWYNDWCYELYVTAEGKGERIRTNLRPVLERADVAAGLLIPLCTKGRGHLSENKAISRHFMLLGFVSEESDHGQREYRDALDWDPSNDNARQLLGEAAEAVLGRQIDNALEQSQKGKWQEAYEILDNTECQSAGLADRVRQVRALVHFRHGNELASQDRYRDALVHATKARELEPNHDVVERFFQEIRDVAPEEENIRNLKTARDAMDHGRFDDAIRAADRVQKGSKLFNQAQNLRSGAHFQRAIEHYEADRYDEAVKDLKAALSLNSVPEERGIIERQIDVVLRSKRGKNFRAAVEKKDWAAAEKILREVLKEDMPKAERKDLRKELSQILNVRAVELMGKAHSDEERLGEAVAEIARVVKSSLQGY